MQEIQKFTLLFKKIEILTEKKINAFLEKEDVTVSQDRYLRFIYRQGGKGVSFKDIEEFFEVSQPTAAGVIKRLEEKGLVFKEKAPDNPHFKTLNLTEEGFALSERLMKDKQDFDSILFSPLSEEEKKAFFESMEKIYENLKNS